MVLLEPVLSNSGSEGGGGSGSYKLGNLGDEAGGRTTSIATAELLKPEPAPSAPRPPLQRRMSRVFEFGIDPDLLPPPDPNLTPTTPAVFNAPSPEPVTRPSSGEVAMASPLARPTSGHLSRFDSIMRKHRAMEQHASWGTLRRLSSPRASGPMAQLDRHAALAGIESQDREQLQLLFDSIDTNHDRKIEVRELRRYMINLSSEYDESNMQDLLNTIDKDKDGVIDFDEFTEFFAGLRINPHHK